MSPNAASGLPVQHIGITVSDLDASLRWYETVLGVAPGGTAENGGADLARALRVGEGTHLRYAFFALPNVLLELVEYLEPRGRPLDRGNHDVGSVHLCLEVPDIEAARARICNLGATFSAPTMELTSGQLAGARFAYFTDPDGFQLQLLQLPAITD